MKSDLEIERECVLEPITKVASHFKIPAKSLETYGNYKAKVTLEDLPQKGKLILVTSINPTPYGEGKTTQSIGLCDALNHLGYKATVCLREPSMGPVFGIKGGATGGGYSQVVPMEDINLHFTGDMHAITSANNLLCAIVDQHLYFGNELGFKKVTIQRCLDVNDRALREVTIHSKYERKEAFQITVASEIMAILCLAKDFPDLKERLGKIIVGYNKDNNPIYCNDLQATDALAILLKDAIRPNIVQTLEHNLAFVHGGPFANIAHGCCSITSMKYALSKFPYVLTEAGFGADLGAEKFLDIVCPEANLKPDAIIINVTIRSLKHHAGISKEQLLLENPTSVHLGLSNLNAHVENMKKFSSNIMVVLNYFATDAPSEIEVVRTYCKENEIPFEVSNTYVYGGVGGEKAASLLVELLKKENTYQKLYEKEETISSKIEKIAREIYHAKDVKYTQEALKDMEELERLQLDKMPICIAKTQYSFSDDKDLLGDPQDFTFHIKSIKVKNGAGFIVAYAGDIMTMPGLGKQSAYQNMHIGDTLEIEGLY